MSKGFLFALAVMLLPAGSLAGESLLFQPAGSRNGTLPDFYVVPGRAVETTREVIYVSARLYAEVAAIVSSTGTSTAGSAFNFFRVTRFSTSPPATVVFMPDKAVGDIIRRMVSAMEAEHETVPTVMSEIAASLS